MCPLWNVWETTTCQIFHISDKISSGGLKLTKISLILVDYLFCLLWQNILAFGWPLTIWAQRTFPRSEGHCLKVILLAGEWPLPHVQHSKDLHFRAPVNNLSIIQASISAKFRIGQFVSNLIMGSQYCFNVHTVKPLAPGYSSIVAYKITVAGWLRFTTLPHLQISELGNLCGTWLGEPNITVEYTQ